MTVRDFIEYLRTVDQEATVKVILHTGGRGWNDQGGNAAVVEFDPELHTDYTDFRGNLFARGKPYENKRTLLLGVHDGDFRVK